MTRTALMAAVRKPIGKAGEADKSSGATQVAHLVCAFLMRGAGAGFQVISCTGGLGTGTPIEGLA